MFSLLCSIDFRGGLVQIKLNSKTSLRNALNASKTTKHHNNYITVIVALLRLLQHPNCQQPLVLICQKKIQANLTQKQNFPCSIYSYSCVIGSSLFNQEMHFYKEAIKSCYQHLQQSGMWEKRLHCRINSPFIHSQNIAEHVIKTKAYQSFKLAPNV